MYKKLFLLSLVVTLLFLFVGNSSFAKQTDGLLKAMEAIGFAPVPKTGQTESFTPGDDGDYQIGITAKNPRFIDNEDGTVTDNLTGLMWTKDAQQILGTMDWYDALTACNDLIFADYDDWRLPNAKELLSLIDFSQDMPVLPINHPFTNVMPGDHYWWCWSSTKQVYHSNYANVVGLGHGEIGGAGHSFAQWVWAVRGGN